MLYAEEGKMLLHNSPRSSQCPIGLPKYFTEQPFFFATDILYNSGTALQKVHMTS